MVVTVTGVAYRALKKTNLLGSNILCAVPMTFILQFKNAVFWDIF